MVSQDGYSLGLASATRPGRPGGSGRVHRDGSGRQAVTGYEVQHEKQLHLIAVRRDFTGFQHVHPTMAPDGTWSTALDLEPGTWRLFADFKPSGADALTLGLTSVCPAPPPLPSP